MAVMQKHVAAN